MTITNTTVVNTASKYIVKSTGIGGETDQIIVDTEKLVGGTNKSLISMIECHYQIKNKSEDQYGILFFTAASEPNNKGLLLTGKYGLRPDQLKFGNDKKIKITTDSNVKSYLLVTEFRRNN